MTDFKPILFDFDGNAMTPHLRFSALCAKQYEVGGSYWLIPHDDRSRETHNHQFAVIASAWEQLPEGIAESFPTPESLRKWCLIKGGFCDESRIVCESGARAESMAATLLKHSPHSLVVVTDAVVTIFTAWSQAHLKMDRKTFQASKTTILEICASMIGVDVETLAKNTLPSVPPAAERAEPSPGGIASGEGRAA
jgi:hypothetical protein